MEQMQIMGGPMFSKSLNDARILFEKYKAEGLNWSVINHPDYEGYYLAEDKVLNVKVVGDTEPEAIDNLKDCVEQFVKAVLDSEDKEAINRLIILPLTDREV